MGLGTEPSLRTAATMTDEASFLLVTLSSLSNVVGLPMMSMLIEVTPTSESFLMIAAADERILSI